MTDTTPDYAGLEALEQAIIGYWGNRCSDFDGNCPCCQSWKQFDALRALLERNAELERERDEAFQKYVDANEARIDAEAQRDEALKALEPFAEDYEKRSRLAPGPDIDHWPIGDCSLTYRHLRGAYELIHPQIERGEQ